MRKHHVPIRTSKYCLSVAVLVMWLAAGVELRADQTVVVRSGNGTIGSQDSLIHVLPFRTTGDITPTPANFSDAQSSPQAYVVTPYGAYIPSLPSDPNAKWIAVNTNLPAGSALFAMPFQVTDSTITAASLDFHFAVDNAVNGVFINGTRISGNSLDGDYHAEFRFVRNDIAPLLIPNATNWIYVNMSDYGVIAALIFNATITTQGTSKDVQPNVGGNTGFVSVQIFGQGFPSGDVSATLSGNGQPDITAISATTIDKNEVDATFDLRGIVPGTRDVSITQGGVSVATFLNSFTVQNGGATQISVSILGPDRIRSGREGTFEVVVTNDGSVDAPFVTVQAAANPIQGSLSTQNAGNSGTTALAALAPQCSLSPTDVYLPAKRSWIAQIACAPQGNACYAMGGDAEEKKPSKDCSAEQEAFNVAEAAVAVIDNKLFVAETDLANLETAYSTCNTVVSCFSLLQQILQKRAEIVFLRIALRNATQRLAQARAALEICLAEKNAQGSSLVTGALRALMSAATTALSSQSSGSFTFCGVTSVDPNAKLGVSGAGQEQYVRVTAPLSYTILFENLPTAGAAASKVIVSDPLDSNLDLSTLSLSSLRFGSTDIELPPGISSYTTPIDLTSTQNLFVNLTAQLVGRTLVVTFTSIDPTTGQPPTDLRGFLPPDTNPPNGEGSVTFTVMPKQGLFTGIQISNAATIVFDTNPAINTPIWLNTIDNSNPVSKVSSLPSNQASYNFNVQWSGTDDGSGIRDFTIYVSDNGGPFSAWLTQTTALQATYKGVGGHTYSFYSIALDLVGNLENLKTSAEATTQVIVDTTPPQIIPQVSGTLVNNGWYRSAVTVNWTVTDPESGIASSSGCAPTILTADTAGATLTCLATNGAGLSASVPVTIKIDTTPPVATASANPSTLWPPNGKMVNVTVSGTVTDATSGVNPNSANFAVVDKYGSVRPSGNVLLAANGTYSFTISLQASRLGTDQNGRTYTVTVTAQDNAGNQSSAATTVVVPHDQGPWRWPTLPTECGEQCRNEEFLRGIQGALRIPSLSFQYLRRPGRTAKLLCFHIAGELGEFAPHRLDHL